jgi:hypothetical protein
VHLNRCEFDVPDLMDTDCLGTHDIFLDSEGEERERGDGKRNTREVGTEYIV